MEKIIKKNTSNEKEKVEEIYKMNVNPYIFREYDIRGKVVEDFPPEVVVSLGKAFGTLVKRSGGREIAISGDIRLTTPDLINFFKEGGFINRS